MIAGTHIVVYSKDEEADRVFFRDILGFPSVDAGHGWLIFAMPPAEVAFHPGNNDRQELYFICGDLKAEMAELSAQGIEFSEVVEARWGYLTKMRLPGGGEIGLYEPRHPTAIGLKSKLP